MIKSIVIEIVPDDDVEDKTISGSLTLSYKGDDEKRWVCKGILFTEEVKFLAAIQEVIDDYKV